MVSHVHRVKVPGKFFSILQLFGLSPVFKYPLGYARHISWIVIKFKIKLGLKISHNLSTCHAGEQFGKFPLHNILQN